MRQLSQFMLAAAEARACRAAAVRVRARVRASLVIVVASQVMVSPVELPLLVSD